MEQDKADERDTEMSLCFDELDNVETVEMSSQAPMNHTVAFGRTRKPNPKDREDVEAEGNYQAKRSLGGHFSRV